MLATRFRLLDIGKDVVEVGVLTSSFNTHIQLTPRIPLLCLSNSTLSIMLLRLVFLVISGSIFARV